VRLEDPRDAHRVARGFNGDLVIRTQALGEQLQRVRGGRYLPDRSGLAVLVDRDLAEVAVNIHADAAQASFLVDLKHERGDAWADDTDGFGLAAQPDKSQGRPAIRTGSRPIER
jgi:hypothetical protein